MGNLCGKSYIEPAASATPRKSDASTSHNNNESRIQEGWSRYKEQSILTIVRDEERLNHFRAWLKLVSPPNSEGTGTLYEYFLFYEDAGKRIAVYSAAQRAGDPQEKIKELTENKAKEMISQHGHLWFDVLKCQLKNNEYKTYHGLGLFDDPRQEVVRRVQIFLNKGPQEAPASE